MSPAYLLKDLLTGLFGSLALLGKECNHLASHPLRGEEEIINLVTKSPPRTEFSSLALLLCCCWWLMCPILLLLLLVQQGLTMNYYTHYILQYKYLSLWKCKLPAIHSRKLPLLLSALLP